MSVTERQRKRWSGRAAIGTALLLLAVVACIRLGFWQLDRLQQRRALNARVAERLRAPLLQTQAQLADSSASLYRLAEVIGRYDDSRSIVLPGHSLNGVPGVHLLTPLLLGPEEAVLVNRGWVPSADAATIPIDSFPASPDGGQRRLTGLLLPLPETGAASSQAQASPGFRRIWYRMDPAALRAQFPYRLLPLQLQLLPSPDSPGLPRRLEPPVLSGGPHLSYAIQWFSFAAIGVIGWLALIRRSRGPRLEPEADLPAPVAEAGARGRDA